MTENEIHELRKQPETLEAFREAQKARMRITVTEDDILTAVRRGINTRHRLLIAFPKEPDQVRQTIATLVYKGLLKTDNRKLALA